MSYELRISTDDGDVRFRKYKSIGIYTTLDEAHKRLAEVRKSMKGDAYLNYFIMQLDARTQTQTKTSSGKVKVRRTLEEFDTQPKTKEKTKMARKKKTDEVVEQPKAKKKTAKRTAKEKVKEKKPAVKKAGTGDLQKFVSGEGRSLKVFDVAPGKLVRYLASQGTEKDAIMSLLERLGIGERLTAHTIQGQMSKGRAGRGIDDISDKSKRDIKRALK